MQNMSSAAQSSKQACCSCIQSKLTAGVALQGGLLKGN